MKLKNFFSLFLLITIPLYSIHNYTNNRAKPVIFKLKRSIKQPVSFKSERIVQILQWMDGVSHMLDGFAIADIEKLSFQVGALKRGIKSPKTNHIVGKYLLNGRYLTIDQLAQITITHENKEALDQLLEMAQADFGKIIDPFLKQIKGIKELIFDLIKESCLIRNLPNSMLLDWGNCKEGLEPIFFKTRVKSFTLLSSFFEDLLIFFEDLKYNCPIACKQYKELQKKAQNNGKH